MTTHDNASPSPPAVQAPRRRKPTTPFSATIARQICLRTMAGETQASICADPAMPCEATLWRWARKHPEFARIYSRARALGERAGSGMKRSYCAVTAQTIAARVSEGESLAAVARDPGMPSLSTIFRWARQEPDFAEALAIAKAVMAERFAEMGWTLAMEATPETVFLTQVRLKQLRWTCAIMSPGTHGRLKASDPPAPPEGMTVLFRHFQIEEHPDPAVRQHRVVGYTPDPETMQPVRDSEGPWTEIVDPVKKAAEVEALAQARRAREGRQDEAASALPAPQDDDDPEGWC